MSIQEIDLKVKELRELQVLVEEATAQMEAIKDAIKLKMVDEGTEVLQGNGWKATWHTVTSSRLDSKALKAAHPDLVAQYQQHHPLHPGMKKAPCISQPRQMQGASRQKSHMGPRVLYPGPATLSRKGESQMEHRTDEDRIIAEIIRIARKLDMQRLISLMFFAVGLVNG